MKHKILIRTRIIFAALSIVLLYLTFMVPSAFTHTDMPAWMNWFTWVMSMGLTTLIPFVTCLYTAFVAIYGVVPTEKGSDNGK